ncbi:MAG: hypothetical protein HY541_05130 [Deltaproteobacteria bacterium]|nr:hypothetical protein [Deltaproteobacteria bacterium]
MIPLILPFLWSCSENGLHPFTPTPEDNIQKGPQNNGGGLSISPCDYVSLAIPGAVSENGTTWDQTKSCPLVLQDGEYGKKGELAEQCVPAMTSAADHMTDSATLFMDDVNLTDLIDCKFGVTVYLELAREIFEPEPDTASPDQTTLSETGQLWMIPGEHLNEIPEFDAQGVTADTFPIDAFGVAVRHTRPLVEETEKDFDNDNLRDLSISNWVAEKETAPPAEDLIDLDYHHLLGGEQNLTVNNTLFYATPSADYTLVPSLDFMYSYSDTFFDLIRLTCNIDAEREEPSYCQVYLSPPSNK